MIWYPSVDDIICLNILVLDMTDDKHPHRLLGSREAIQVIIDKVRKGENRGLTYQAALLMKELAGQHVFDGANHRTAYAAARSFLLRNGRQLRIKRWTEAYPFIKSVETRSIEEIKRWIEHGQEEDVPREP